MRYLAYFDTSHEMPEEIISAAGFIPYKILGDVHVPNEPADQYLPNFFCPAAKSWLTEALSSSQKWEGIIVAQGCNTTNRHYDVWYRHVKTGFLYWFNGPLKDDTLALKFLENEMNRLIEALNKHFHLTINSNDLADAINISNKIKEKMRSLSKLRAEKDIPNIDYLNIITDTLTSSRENVLSQLDETITQWQARPPFPAGKKKVYLTGSDITYGEWMETLEQCDVRVVRDDLSIGERYFAHSIPDNPDPVRSLATYYLNIPKPATKPGIDKRIAYILTSLKETPVDGIISQNLKFCEPFAYDSVTVNNVLKEKGYKLIHIERDFTPVIDHQMINRISAFSETL